MASAGGAAMLSGEGLFLRPACPRPATPVLWCLERRRGCRWFSASWCCLFLRTHRCVGKSRSD